MPAGLADALKQEALEQGFALAGIAKVPGGERIALRTAALQRWLNAGHQADMAWMQNPRRQAIEQLLPGVQSVLAVALNYYVDQEQAASTPKIARYGLSLIHI